MATIKVGEERDLALKITDAGGNTAQVDGVPIWQQTDAAVCDLIVDANGLSAIARTKGNVGRTIITAKGDVDLGAGEKLVTSQEYTLDVVAGEATTIEIIEGATRPIPA